MLIVDEVFGTRNLARFTKKTAHVGRTQNIEHAKPVRMGARLLMMAKTDRVDIGNVTILNLLHMTAHLKR